MTRIWALALLLVGGCHEGSLVIELERPIDQTLDPLRECVVVAGKPVCERPEPRLSRFSLRVAELGKRARTQDTDAVGSGLSIGEVPVDTPFDLRLAAHTVTGQILGLGIAQDLRVPADGDTRVLVPFRKPVAYVTGGPKLAVLDMAAASAFELPPVALNDVVDAATTRDGTMLVAITIAKLMRLRTSDHFALGCNEGPDKCREAIDLAGAHKQPASCLALSPDASAALVCHESGLSAVTRLDQPEPAVRFFAASGKPTAAVFERDGRHAWVLLDGVSESCDGAGKSTLRRVDVTEATPVGQPIALPEAAADLALDPLDGKLLVALPCHGGSGALGRIEGTALKLVLEGLPQIFDLAVTAQNIVLAGAAPLDSTPSGRPLPLEALALVIDRSDPDRPDFPDAEDLKTITRRFALPTIDVRLSSDASPQGFLEWVSQPTAAAVFDLAVSPDGQRALLMVRGAYASDMQLTDCLYRTELTSTSFLAVDLDTGTLLFDRFTNLDFTRCGTTCAAFNGLSMADPNICAQAFTTVMSDRGQLATPQFRGRATALLFGGD